MTQTYSQNYNKLKNNLSILNLTQMNFHFDEYLELINSGKKDLVEALIELTQMEMAVRESNREQHSSELQISLFKNVLMILISAFSQH